MSAAVNHFISGVLNPYIFGLLGVVAAWVLGLGRKRWRKVAGFALMVLSLVWIWIWSTGVWYRAMELGLERDFPPVDFDALPDVDAIVVLGGGMGFSTNECPHAEIYDGGDRVWMGSALWKLGKSGKIICSGGGAEVSTVPLLEALGVDRNAIMLVDEAKNTEDESRMIGDMVRGMKALEENSMEPSTPKILLVTSAWHMRRAVQLFGRSGLEVVPAPADYDAITRVRKEELGEIKNYLPNAECMYRNTYLFKEYLAYWAYRYLKGYR